MYVYNPKNFSVSHSATTYNLQSTPDVDNCTPFGVSYKCGQITKGTSKNNSYSGSIADYNVWSYPTSAGTSEDNGTANIMDLRFTWGKGTYYHDFFMTPNNNSLWHRSVVDSSSGSWYKIVQEDGGSYNITSSSTNLLAGYSPSRYVPAWGYYSHAETPGYLILTDIPVNTNTMFVAHIWGNSYTAYRLPLDLYIQGYTYGAKVYDASVGMLSNGKWIGRSYIFSYNGNVGIWLPYTGSYVSLYADIRIASGLSTPTLNHCISITGSSKPTTGVSDEVAIPMHNSIYYNDEST